MEEAWYQYTKKNYNEIVSVDTLKVLLATMEEQRQRTVAGMGLEGALLASTRYARISELCREQVRLAPRHDL